jgi:alpha,alpha-trehalase
LSLVVHLIASVDGNGTLVTYFPELQQEWNFWMGGTDALLPGQDYRNSVRLADGTLLNRYWDTRDAPRDESYKEDVQTASTAGRPAPLGDRNLRTTAESGWDFSSRWLEDGETLGTVRTVSILPVDLNSLLMYLERTLSEAYQLAGNDQRAATYHRRAEGRAEAIASLMWDAQNHIFSDYLWRSICCFCRSQQSTRRGRSLRPYSRSCWMWAVLQLRS